MSYLITIAFSFSAGFVAGILFYRHNQIKIEADAAKVKDISSKL